MIFAGVVSLLSLLTLRQDVVAPAGADPAGLVTDRQASLAANYNSAFLLGQSLMPALNALLLGYLMYRSGLVPRILPALGLIGGPLLFSADIGDHARNQREVLGWSVLALSRSSCGSSRSVCTWLQGLQALSAAAGRGRRVRRRRPGYDEVASRTIVGPATGAA